MQKRFSFVFVLSVITAAGIFIFQVYWVYNTFKVGKDNFIRTASNALAKSIDTYEVQQSQLPSSLKYKDPSLSVFMRTYPDRPAPDSILSMMKGAKKTFAVDYKSMVVNPNDLPMVKLMMAHLLSQQLSLPIKVDKLTAIFRSELAKNNINLPFTLRMLTNQTKVPSGQIAVPVSFLKSPTVVVAVLDDTWKLLLAQNLAPAMISFILIILSAGSLFYMGYVIKKQIELDDIKNAFINNITHELRTPVSILKTSNEALTNFGALQDPERADRYLQINSVVLDKLDADIERILEITQYEHGVKLPRYEVLNVKDLIEETLQIFALNEHGVVRFEDGLNDQDVNIDGHIIRTIVFNLVDNALKYANGEVMIVVKTVATDKGWKLLVIDNGKGINKADLPFIFDKFYRIQQENIHDIKGYGLGLSYVKQLVKSLNGTIAVESKIGKGSTFTINLPL